MTGNIYKVSFNFEEIRNEVMTYDWITDGVMHRIVSILSINVQLKKCTERGHREYSKEEKKINQRQNFRLTNTFNLST